MSRIALEVSRRLTPGYAKERAREMARERMSRTRDRAIESSWFAPLLGAGIGALVAKTLQSRAQQGRGWEDRERFGYRGEPAGRGYEYGYPRGSYARYAAAREYDEYGTAAGLSDEALAGGREASGETGSKLADKAAEVKERARAGAEQVKERVQETKEQVKGRLQEATSSVRERLPDRERIRTSAYEDTGLWALGALALGALFGFALPETERERGMLEPARRKARELGEQALEKGTEAMEKATEKVASAGGEPRQPGATGTPPSAEPPTALH
jgi:hypothetical protein